MFVILVCLAGVTASELIFRSSTCRDLIGRVFGRGRLIALVRGIGVYDSDLHRELEADRYASGLPNDRRSTTEETKSASNRLVIDVALRPFSHEESVAASSVSRERDLLRSQFGNERIFVDRMRNAWLFRENHCGRNSSII